MSCVIIGSIFFACPSRADRRLSIDRGIAVAGQGPADVFGHQLRRMVGFSAKRRQHLRGGRRIAQGNRDVAQPALMADAANGRTLQTPFELLFAPLK